MSDYETYKTSPYYDPSVSDDDDDGTMVDNIATLSYHVIGHRIVSAERKYITSKSPYGWENRGEAFVITLDNGKQVVLRGTSDCCAGTDLETFLLNVDKIDHVITGVRSEEEYTRWRVFADLGDVLELTVSWSCGNPFYYGYGFDIEVVEGNV